MESYNNLIELRRAEKSTEEATQYRSMSRSRSQPETQHIYVDGNTSPPNTEGRSSFYGPSITRSPSPTSSAPKSESDDSNSDDEITDEADDDANGTKSKDQTDQATSDISVAERPAPRFFSRRRSSRSDTSDIAIHRESDRLLQMVPYRTRVSNGIRSDRLIPDRHGIDSDLKSATQEATKSVRLLLDKWTTSGSAPVSTILDEEAAREKNEALVEEPTIIFELTDIISPVRKPIIVEHQALNPIGTDHRNREDFRLMKINLIPPMIVDGITILPNIKMIICRSIVRLVHNKRISGAHLIHFLDHQINLEAKYWPQCGVRGVAFIIQKATNSSRYIMLISILSTYAHWYPHI